MHLNRLLRLLIATLVLVPGSPVCADEIEYEISGIDEPMLGNVISHVSAYRVGSSARLNQRLQNKLLADAKNAARNAMRPYGYFNPVISVSIRAKEEGKWLLSIGIEAGPPVIVTEIQLAVTGPGGTLEPIKEWSREFPLEEGEVLNQTTWDAAKLEASELLEAAGYLQAKFTRHSISVDPMANTARLALVLDTGPQAVMGKVTFNQDILNEGVLAGFQRFQMGDAYNSLLLENFRLDLWRSGYFEDVEVVERRDLAINPARVDLDVNFVPRAKNTYQSTLGFGTDTLVRGQFLWSRHLLSSRGDNLNIGFGWQQKDNEFAVQTNYRLPRETNPRQFWIASAGLMSEKQQLEVSQSGDLERRFDVARGTVSGFSWKMGKTRARNMQGRYEQLFETVFIEYLNETRDLSLTQNAGTALMDPQDPGWFAGLLKNTSNSAAVGMEWDWPDIHGSGFYTAGHHEKAWVFTSNSAWGSDTEFSQVYLSSRWNFLAGERWKFLLRAEAGYSNARTSTVNIPVDDVELAVSTTELPSQYRFKAGGGRSVRGYAFELLDSNGLGSNNILSASTEVEYRFLEDWSAAAFVDIGNAFNDWGSPSLKMGTGFGLRWYSKIGALRLDIAQGLDLKGDPWRIHLTIGTPLL
ncbi:MAG: BamA/TamA family outer membrane protein [Xanthomonadales bacterium]|nr:BamA/TamA family outer membrane protein [Xanthomonadales bacterium]